MLKRRVVFAMLLALSGCSAEQAYYAGQAWQRNQCAGIPDKADYERCLRNADGSYQSYREDAARRQDTGR
jgi:hypothetical protein